MTRNDMLQWFILRVGLSGPDEELGHPTNLAQLCQDANKQCFPCERDEVLDALYTMPREYAALIKYVFAGEGLHPVSFERVRNTKDWTDYFASGDFHVKVLSAGKTHFQELSQTLAATASSSCR